MNEHTQYAENLALYALDALDNQQERAELEAHLGGCPECRDELARLRGDAALLAFSTVGPAPPQRARQRLMDAIAQERRRNVQPFRPRLGVLRARWMTFMPVAATILLAIFSMMLLNRNSKLIDRLDRKNAELNQTREQLAARDKDLQQAQGILDVLHAPDAQPVTLVQMKKQPQPQVRTVYSAGKGRLFLIADNLETLPQGKVYELWLLPANGAAPMPAGVFKPDGKGFAMMDHPMDSAGIQAKGFAITVEPEGGSQTPTMPIKMAG